MGALHALVVSLAVGCFAAFGWAMRRLFTIPDGKNRLMKALSLCATACALVHLVALVWFVNSGPLASAAGALLYFVALLIFWWCVETTRTTPLSFAFSQDAPTHLMRTGPYALVRHPFYTSYMLAWLAGALATRQPWLLITVILMGTFYRWAADLEEAKFATSPLHAQYATYAASTGRFFPRLWRSKLHQKKHVDAAIDRTASTPRG